MRRRRRRNPGTDKVNVWFGQPRRHRRAARKGWRKGHFHRKGRKRGHRIVRVHRRRRTHKRRKSYKSNAPHYFRHKRSRRRHRRNPAISIGAITSQFTNVKSWVPLAITGAMSAITGAIAPSMLGIANPWAKLGVQTVIAIGGGLVVDKFIGSRHGEAWMIVGVSMVGYQLLKQFVLAPYFPAFAVGLGDYPNYYMMNRNSGVSQETGAFVGAFPNELGAYPGVGDDMGSYPYDGSGY